MNRLNAWLQSRKVRKAEFAAEIGVSPGYLSNLCADPPAFWPGREVVLRIRAATGGAITADSFLPPRDETPPAEPPAGACHGAGRGGASFETPAAPAPDEGPRR